MLPPWVIKAINPCFILQSFSRLGELTVFLNDYFNTFDLYTFDKERFYMFLRDIVREKKIDRSRLAFFKHHKEDKVLTSIHTRLPLLKRREVIMLMDEIRKDPELYTRYAEMWGLEVPKKTKLTKKEQKEALENDADPIEKPKKQKNPAVKKANKQANTIQPVSFGSWKSGFNKGDD